MASLAYLKCHIRSQYQQNYPRVDNPGKPIGGHRSSTTVPSVTTSVAVTVFTVATGGPPVGNGGQRWAIGGDQWAIGGPPEGRQ